MAVFAGSAGQPVAKPGRNMTVSVTSEISIIFCYLLLNYYCYLLADIINLLPGGVIGNT